MNDDKMAKDAEDYGLAQKFATCPVDYMQDGLTRYVLYGIRPGDFLTAVICGDLFQALGHADDNNSAHMREWAQWFYSKAPAGCWGSTDRFREWIKHGGLVGQSEKARAASEA